MGSDRPTRRLAPIARLSLRAKLRIGFGGLLLILLTVSGMSVVVLTHYESALERVFRENYASIALCESMKNALDELNNEAQRLLWDRSASPTAAIQQSERQFDDSVARQQRISFLPGEQVKSDALVADWSSFRAEYEHFIASPDARQETYRNVLMPHTRSLRVAVQELSEMNLQNMLAVDGRVRTTVAAVRNALIVLAAAGSTLAVLFVIAVGPSMLRPLSALTRSARQIADGQLDLHVEVHSRDEVGQLAEAFNVMAEHLRAARVRDRDRLVRTEQTTQMAIDSLPDAVVVLGADGQIELTNRAASDLFALKPQNASTKPPWLTALFEKVIGGGQRLEPDGYRAAMQKFYHGEERFFLPHAVPLLSADGRTIGVTVVLADVTRLKEADEAKSDLVSTVSHELRTPLTSIRMALHLLCDNSFGPLQPKQTELLETARDNSDRLHRILEHLLGISRIESGRAPLKLERIPAGDIIAQALSTLRESYADAGVDLQSSPLSGDAADNAAVLADPNSIGYVLTNLLTNSLRYTPRGGSVRVSCVKEIDSFIFSVTDTGRGIEPQHLPHLFEKFYRVASPSAHSGAGLGLSIAKEIIEAHGGTMSVQSTPGQGATFTFSLRLP